MSDLDIHAGPAAPGARLSRSSMADILKQERDQAASQVRHTQVTKVKLKCKFWGACPIVHLS